MELLCGVRDLCTILLGWKLNWCFFASHRTGENSWGTWCRHSRHPSAWQCHTVSGKNPCMQHQAENSSGPPATHPSRCSTQLPECGRRNNFSKSIRLFDPSNPGSNLFSKAQPVSVGPPHTVNIMDWHFDVVEFVTESRDADGEQKKKGSDCCWPGPDLSVQLILERVTQ